MNRANRTTPNRFIIPAWLLLITIAGSLPAFSENWGQPDSEEKFDAHPWMWSIRGRDFESPESVAEDMTRRLGIWGGVFSWFRHNKEVGNWVLFEEVESRVLWSSENLAIVFGYAELHRSEMCGAWVLLARDESGKRWVACDALIRRDIGYSHVETTVYDDVREAPGPILLIDTFRGGRRLGDQSYEFYCLTDQGHPARYSPNSLENSRKFHRCLGVKTRYSQGNSWLGEARFSQTEDRDLQVDLLRENMAMGEKMRSTLPLSWDPEKERFDSRAIEDFIGLDRLAQEDRATGELE